MTSTTQFTTTNKQYNLKTTHKNNFLYKNHTQLKSKMNNKNKGKVSKLMLSSLFNNYNMTPHNTMKTKYMMQKNYTHNWNMKEKPMMKNKQSILWLGKTHDTNSLYPWTKNQKMFMKQTTLHMDNKNLSKSQMTFLSHTQYNHLYSEWKLNPHTQFNHHHSFMFRTKSLSNNSNKQYNLKHLTQSSKMKNTMNINNGKLKVQNMNNKNSLVNQTKMNNKKALSIMEYSKMKLNNGSKNYAYKQMDAMTHTSSKMKKLKKGKTGYQKNETLTIHTHKDNFKMCNTMTMKNMSNKMDMQTQSKMKH